VKYHRGFIHIDIAIGLAVVAILALGIAMLVSQGNHASQQLARTRAATRLAEDVLWSLQTGESLPVQSDDVKFQITPVEGGQTVPDYRWCEIVATDHGRSARVTGLAPAKAVVR
jgi:hypothetical protein